MAHVPTKITPVEETAFAGTHGIAEKTFSICRKGFVFLLTSEWFYLGIILLIGLLLRAWYLSEIVHAPDFAAPQQDADVQDYHARAMATGDWTVRPGENDPEIRTTPYFRPPGYPYYLSVIYSLTGGSYMAPRIVQLILGLASIVLIYLLARGVFGPLAALSAAFLQSIYWGFIYWEGELNDPALFVFLGLLLMHMLRLWRLKMTFMRAFAAGILVGAYALMRPNILLFGPFIAAWMLWVAWRRKNWKRMIPAWIALALAPFLMIAPVTIRNYLVSGEFVPISTYFGENFLIGNGEDSDGITPWTPYLQELEGTGRWSVWVYVNVVKGLGKQLGRPDLGHAEASSYFFRKGLDYAKAHKMRTLKLAIKKAVLFWSPLEITCNKVVQDEKDFYRPLKYLPGFSLLTGLFAGGCGLLALGLFRRRSTPWPDGAGDMIVLALAFVAVYYLSFIPFFVNGRARVPITPFLIFFGSYAVSCVLRAAADRAYVRSAFVVSVLAILCALVNIQYIPYVPDHARWHYQRADSFLRQNRVSEALDEGRKLLDLGTGMPYMHHRLAEGFAQKNRFEEAEEHYRATLKLQPEFQNLHYMLANVLVKLRKMDEAMAAYREAIRLNPNDARAHHELGALLANAGQTDEAMAHFEKAVTIAPHFGAVLEKMGRLLAAQGKAHEALARHEAIIAADPSSEEAYYNYGRELTAQRKISEAIAAFEKALALDPSQPRARNAIAAIHAEQGRIEEAIAAYEESIRTAPNDKTAYTDLAVNLADRGRIDEAIGLFQEAIRIDPGYAYALDRLGRLLAAKGQSQKAIDYYQAAREADPDNQDIHYLLGRELIMQGKKDEAAAETGEAPRLNPDDARAH
ncbi:MAG TPA: tetratricopeptide repeat protein, partial [Candidatus Hydrogenedentes bacterium]|nr:tetratricopeptide repeat protein [Candidatus Hydrogenedentota bacterium]